MPRIIFHDFSPYFPVTASPLENTLYAEFSTSSLRKRRRCIYALIYVRIRVFMLGTHLYGTPRLSQAWTPSAAICYSNVALYICLGVGGWSPKCETRCNAGPPGILSSREAHPRDCGLCAYWKDFRRFAYPLSGSHFFFSLFLLSFLIKKRIYLFALHDLPRLRSIFFLRSKHLVDMMSANNKNNNKNKSCEIS